MAHDLSQLGIVPRKTHIATICDGLLEFRNAPALRHAIRGMIEGDGSICYKRHRNGHWCVSLVGTHAVTYAVQSAINATVLESSMSKARGCLSQQRNSWQLCYDGRHAAALICNWMYTDADRDCVLI